MAEQLKHWISKELISKLAAEIAKIQAGFDHEQFVQLVYGDDWESLELKQRIRRITESLGATLPEYYPKAVDTLDKVVHHFDGQLFAMVFPDFVEVYGVDNYETSISKLASFTQYMSSEFAVRPFIIKYPEKMMAQMLEWADDTNHHIRRLASEGCRPRLPWAMALPEFKKDPAPVLPILEKLKEDPEEYVRRSVANNLNDISKDHPDLLLNIARNWMGSNPQTDKLLKHACRGMLKKGDARFMVLFGFSDPKNISVPKLKVNTPKVKIGEDLKFSFDILSRDKSDSNIRVEYAIDYMKSNGKHSTKVFKITENKYPLGEPTTLERKQSFKDFTTRKHYPGTHAVAIIINGVEKAKQSFEVSR